MPLDVERLGLPYSDGISVDFIHQSIPRMDIKGLPNSLRQGDLASAGEFARHCYFYATSSRR